MWLGCFTALAARSLSFFCRFIPLQMVLPKAQIEDNADATIVRAQMHLQETQVVDVDRICKQASVDKSLPLVVAELPFC